MRISCYASKSCIVFCDESAFYDYKLDGSNAIYFACGICVYHGCQMAIAGFLESYVFGPLGFWTMAPLRYAAIFDPFLSLDCAPTPSTLAQSKERKGSNFAIWQHWPQRQRRQTTKGIFERSKSALDTTLRNSTRFIYADGEWRIDGAAPFGFEINSTLTHPSQHGPREQTEYMEPKVTRFERGRGGRFLGCQIQKYGWRILIKF